MEEIRKKIDEIDNEIIRLIAKRVELVPEVALTKKKQGMAISQPEREKRVLESRMQSAEVNGVDPALVEKIFKLMMEDSKKIQEKLLEERE